MEADKHIEVHTHRAAKLQFLKRYKSKHPMEVSWRRSSPCMLQHHLEKVRERMTQIMFKTFYASTMYMAIQAVLFLYASGQQQQPRKQPRDWGPEVTRSPV